MAFTPGLLDVFSSNDCKADLVSTSEEQEGGTETWMVTADCGSVRPRLLFTVSKLHPNRSSRI